ncbi:MAG: class IV adenylate cyclase [Phycisphaerales bacterium]|nr:class IV adenylate cyclase [Phycisphaerales bacterium]
MAIEIEFKFPLPDKAEVRQRLIAAGGAVTHDERETNTLFDTPERELLAADAGLRIRECAPRLNLPAHPNTLTYKGPAGVGAAKSREEIELVVGDCAAAALLLRRLGYESAVIYEKNRETWRLGPCVVTIDELPELGAWLEIEGPSETAVRAMREALNFADVAPVRESYVAMAARVGRRRADGAVELRF